MYFLGAIFRSLVINYSKKIFASSLGINIIIFKHSSSLILLIILPHLVSILLHYMDSYHNLCLEINTNIVLKIKNCFKISTKSAWDNRKIHILKLIIQQLLSPQVGWRPLPYRLMCLQTKPKEHLSNEIDFYRNRYFLMCLQKCKSVTDATVSWGSKQAPNP